MNSIKPSVLIVILNYGTFERTLKLIRELQVELEYNNYEVMVVDNCSPNESAEVLKKNSKEMNFIFYENETNAGYAAGNNIGIRYGIENGFDYSWILNNDVELREKNVLAHMISIAERNPKVGCVGPMIYTFDGSICAPYCRRLTLWNMTFGIAAEKKYRKKYIHVSREVYRVYGCCMILNNKAMADVDCMDERTFLYGEEDILAERMLAKEYVSYYDAAVSITHKESTSMKKMLKNRKEVQIRETNKSMELYLKEYRKFSVMARWVCKLVKRLIIQIR